MKCLAKKYVIKGISQVQIIEFDKSGYSEDGFIENSCIFFISNAWFKFES